MSCHPTGMSLNCHGVERSSIIHDASSIRTLSTTVSVHVCNGRCTSPHRDGPCTFTFRRFKLARLTARKITKLSSDVRSGIRDKLEW